MKKKVWRFVMPYGAWITGVPVTRGDLVSPRKDGLEFIPVARGDWLQLDDGRVVNLRNVLWAEVLGEKEVMPREGSVSEGAREG